jgi:hypothetical protein
MYLSRNFLAGKRKYLLGLILLVFTAINVCGFQYDRQ